MSLVATECRLLSGLGCFCLFVVWVLSFWGVNFHIKHRNKTHFSFLPYAGFRRKEFRGKLAIAITANFINRNSTAEAKVEEISGVAFIFNQKFFQDLKEETGGTSALSSGHWSQTSEGCRVASWLPGLWALKGL